MARVEFEDREIKTLEAERAERVLHDYRYDLRAESTSKTLGVEEANGVAGAPVLSKRMQPCRAENCPPASTTHATVPASPSFSSQA